MSSSAVTPEDGNAQQRVGTTGSDAGCGGLLGNTPAVAHSLFKTLTRLNADS